MRDYWNNYVAWFNIPWEVRRGVYTFLLYYSIISFSSSLLSVIIN